MITALASRLSSFAKLVTCRSLSEKIAGLMPRQGNFPLQHLYDVTINFLR